VGVAEAETPELTEEEQRRLAEGQTVLKRMMIDGGIHGLAAQRIKAPAALVWRTLNDFPEWPNMVDHCIEASVYERGGDDHIGSAKARVVLGVAFVKICAHVHHKHDMAAGRITWSLDKSRESNCLSNDGFWMVRPDASDPLGQHSVVYYSAAVALGTWAPKWLNSFIGEQGLPKAVGWIRREAEKRWVQQAPARAQAQAQAQAPRQDAACRDVAVSVES
jgi:hypothetical protein